MVARVVVLLTVVVLAVPAVRTVTAGPAPSLFPLVVGAVWVRKNDDGGEAITRVVGSKTVGTTRCTIVERKAVERGRERVGRTCFLATASEVLIIEWTTPRGEVQILNPPRAAIKLPPRIGQTWSWSPANPAFQLKITEKWIGEETIKVAAGTFRAWKLQTVATGEDSEITTYTWYAPGVGAVRSERKGHRGDRQISGWSELVSYKIP